MSRLDAAIRATVGQHLAGASRAQVLRIAEILLEDEPAIATTIDIPRKLSTAGGRYLRVSEDLVTGSAEDIPDSAWTLTWDQETGLVWTHVLGDPDNGQGWEPSCKLAQAYKLRNHVVSFEAPDIRQLLSIIDYERYDPAVDPAHFKGPFGYTWTSTPYKGASGFAWGVGLRTGDVSWYYQDGHNQVRAVLAGQSIGLGD